MALALTRFAAAQAAVADEPRRARARAYMPRTSSLYISRRAWMSFCAGQPYLRYSERCAPDQTVTPVPDVIVTDDVCASLA